jgi:hypothetical protein
MEGPFRHLLYEIRASGALLRQTSLPSPRSAGSGHLLQGHRGTVELPQHSAAQRSIGRQLAPLHRVEQPAQDRSSLARLGSYGHPDSLDRDVDEGQRRTSTGTPTRHAPRPEHRRHRTVLRESVLARARGREQGVGDHIRQSRIPTNQRGSVSEYRAMTTATAWRRSSPCSGDQDCVDGLDRVIPGVRSVRVASRARAYASCSSLPATSCGATARS